MNQYSLICKYIKEHPNTWEKDMEEKSIRVSKNGNLCLFKYYINADFYDPLVCEARGIIIDVDTLEVVGIGFNKFFNHHEPYASEIDWNSCKVQDKKDGCVDENTMILTNYGPTPIKDIAKSGRSYKVLTYNHITGQNEFNEIENILVTDNDDKQWYEIETDMGNLRLTGNHKVFIKNENCYKRVDELSGNEELLLIEPGDYKLTGRLNTYPKIYNMINDNVKDNYINGEPILSISNKYQLAWGVISKILLGYFNICHRNLSSQARI